MKIQLNFVSFIFVLNPDLKYLKKRRMKMLQKFSLCPEMALSESSRQTNYSAAQAVFQLSQLNGAGLFSFLADASTDRNIENRISVLHKECNEVPAGGAARRRLLKTGNAGMETSPSATWGAVIIHPALSKSKEINYLIAIRPSAGWQWSRTESAECRSSKIHQKNAINSSGQTNLKLHPAGRSNNFGDKFYQTIPTFEWKICKMCCNTNLWNFFNFWLLRPKLLFKIEQSVRMLLCFNFQIIVHCPKVSLKRLCKWDVNNFWKLTWAHRASFIYNFRGYGKCAKFGQRVNCSWWVTSWQIDAHPLTSSCTWCSSAGWSNRSCCIIQSLQIFQRNERRVENFFRRNLKEFFPKFSFWKIVIKSDIPDQSFDLNLLTEPATSWDFMKYSSSKVTWAPGPLGGWNHRPQRPPVSGSHLNIEIFLKITFPFKNSTKATWSSFCFLPKKRGKFFVVCKNSNVETMSSGPTDLLTSADR